jgi:hypothetical protein
MVRSELSKGRLSDVDALLELPGLEDVDEPGFVALHAEDFVHDAELHKPKLLNAAGLGDVDVAEPEALVVRPICVVGCELTAGDVDL